MKNKNKYYENVESMLYGYKKTLVEIKNIDLDIEEVMNNYIGCTAITYKEKSAPTNKFNSVVENEVLSREKNIKYLNDLKRSKEIQIERIDNMLSVLTEEEYRIIELRYFKKLQFKEVGNILCKSDIYLMSLRKKIIEEKLIPIIKI